MKLKIIKFFSLFIRTAFAENWTDVPVMRKLWDKNGKIINASNQEFNNFLGREIFMPV